LPPLPAHPLQQIPVQQQAKQPPPVPVLPPQLQLRAKRLLLLLARRPPVLFPPLPAHPLQQIPVQQQAKQPPPVLVLPPQLQLGAKRLPSVLVLLQQLQVRAQVLQLQLPPEQHPQLLARLLAKPLPVLRVHPQVKRLLRALLLPQLIQSLAQALQLRLPVKQAPPLLAPAQLQAKQRLLLLLQKPLIQHRRLLAFLRQPQLPQYRLRPVRLPHRVVKLLLLLLVRVHRQLTQHPPQLLRPLQLRPRQVLAPVLLVPLQRHLLVPPQVLPLLLLVALPRVLLVLALLLLRPKQCPLLPVLPLQAHQLHRRSRQRLLRPFQLLPTQVVPPLLQRRSPVKQPPQLLARPQVKQRLLVLLLQLPKPHRRLLLALRQPQRIQRRPLQVRLLHQQARLLLPVCRLLQVLQVLALALSVKQHPLVLVRLLAKQPLLLALRQPQRIQRRPLQVRLLHQQAKLLRPVCQLLQVLQVLALALPVKQHPLVLRRPLQVRPVHQRVKQRLRLLRPPLLLQHHSSSTSTTSTTSSSSSTSSSSVTIATSTTSTSTASNQNVSTCVETFSIGNTNLLLTCPSNTSMLVLPINGYSMSTRNGIRTLTVQGANGKRGPLSTIPPNICFLPNLLELNVSYNSLTRLDTSFFSSNPSCLSNLQKLNADQNLITEYPSDFLTHTPNLQRLLLPNNQLTSFDLASTVLVDTAVDLSNNQISKITNNANINISKYSNPYYTAIDLSNNSAVIDVSDALFEMYGACYEVIQAFNSSAASATPVLTISLLNIDFGTSRINCSCSQYYLERSLLSTFRSNLISSDPLSNTKCLDGSLFYNNTNILQCSNSSATFTNSVPRLCIINQNNTGVIYTNTTDNSTSTQTYPYYLTQSSNSTYCMYTFYSDGIKAAINCVDGSNNLTEIAPAILTNKYFQNISQVVVNNQNSISELPSYLCSLPSARIDLSNQSFVILDKDTFPCSTYNTLQYINLTDNPISFVNLTYTNWTVFDLSSNNLTQLPYTLLNVNQSSIQPRDSTSRTLDVSSNQISQLDLFAYTYPSTSINLESNSFTKTTNGYNVIKNVQQKSLRSGPVSSNVDLPSQSRFLVNDQLAQNYNTCDSRTLINLINILQYMKNDGVTVELECQCSSIYLSEYLLLYNSSDKLTSRFSCSNTSSLNQAQFDSLAESDCLNNITLSSDRLCQFASRVSLAASSPSSDNGRLLAIILGSILGSIAFIALLALLICCLCRKRKKSPEKSSMTVMSRPPVGGNASHDGYAAARSLQSPPHHVAAHDFRLSAVSENLPEIGEYSLSRHEPIYIRDSIDSLQQDVFEQRERNRQLRQPPIDYDTSRSFRHLDNPSPNSSYT
ncbi:unnamed protein product, partial [Adineta ricciae]